MRCDVGLHGSQWRQTMSADIELLRLAAKAAGMVILEQPWDDIDGWFFCEQHGKPAMHFRKYGNPNYSIKPWIPLDDDGDALRLAVALEIELSFINGDTHADGQSEGGPDKQANTRRAIVRAAAEIGKTMP